LLSSSERDTEDYAKGLALCQQAARLGEVQCQLRVGLECTEDDPERFVWWKRAMENGLWTPLTLMVLAAKTADKRVMFELGRVCAGKIDSSQCAIFGRTVEPEGWRAMLQAERLYDATCRVATDAIHCWLLVARRVGVVRDIRILIARLAWEQRSGWIA
jgi:hypothetical protein